ncbi:autotransporter adhesin family protein, partial [Salmonella enterica]|nr:autotransporter adhesin family protein [Salmonella enterica]
MKRHLNTSYRLVWNHITGTLVVASELARSRGKRTGVAVALSLAAVTSVPALAADTVVQAGETVNDGTLTNHDNQIVFGTANGMTISTGLEGTVAKLAMRQPFVLFKGLTFQKLCLP